MVEVDLSTESEINNKLTFKVRWQVHFHFDKIHKCNQPESIVVRTQNGYFSS
jgi:hypothetical protein